MDEIELMYLGRVYFSLIAIRFPVHRFRPFIRGDCRWRLHLPLNQCATVYRKCIPGIKLDLTGCAADKFAKSTRKFGLNNKGFREIGARGRIGLQLSIVKYSNGQ